jgi:NADPH-dependent glutamate synthase beta subunit-like oxidoreductase
MLIHTLGPPDSSGRRHPDPIQQTEFTLPCDMVIAALGQQVAEDIQGLALRPDGTFDCDPETGATALDGVFVGGDATGPDSVIAAIASGRKGAASIDIYLMGESAVLSYDPVPTEASRERALARARNVTRAPRLPLALRPAIERRRDFDLYTPVLSEEEAVAEASRCLSCGCGAGCGLCYRMCSNFAVAPAGADSFAVDEEKCAACGLCYHRCPNDNIEMVRLPGTV